MNHDVETNKNSKYSHKEWKEKGVGVGAGVGGEEKASDNTRGEMVETGRTNSNSDTDDTTTTITATVGTISTSLEGTSLEGTRLEETSQATQATTIPATQAQATTTSIQKTTLWMGELEYWMDEGFLVEKWWELLGEKLPFLKLKLIRDRFTGYVILRARSMRTTNCSAFSCSKPRLQKVSKADKCLLQLSNNSSLRSKTN